MDVCSYIFHLACVALRRLPTKDVDGRDGYRPSGCNESMTLGEGDSLSALNNLRRVRRRSILTSPRRLVPGEMALLIVSECKISMPTGAQKAPVLQDPAGYNWNL